MKLETIQVLQFLNKGFVVPYTIIFGAILSVILYFFVSETFSYVFIFGITLPIIVWTFIYADFFVGPNVDVDTTLNYVVLFSYIIVRWIIMAMTPRFNMIGMYIAEIIIIVYFNNQFYHSNAAKELKKRINFSTKVNLNFDDPLIDEAFSKFSETGLEKITDKESLHQYFKKYNEMKELNL